MAQAKATTPTVWGMNGYQWIVIFAAWLGWGFDVFDGLLFNFVAPGAVVWTSRPTGEEYRVLPDGCMDIIWATDGSLVVAGPSTASCSAGSRIASAARAR
jgi:hypothetical protein